MDSPLYSRPALVGDALYPATANRLYLIAAKDLNPVARDAQNVTSGNLPAANGSNERIRTDE